MAENEKNEVLTEDGSAKDKKPKAAPAKAKVSIWKKLGTFFKECKGELKKIVWYGRDDTFRSTVLVIACIVIAGALIGAFDYLFSTGIMSLGKLVN